MNHLYFCPPNAMALSALSAQFIFALTLLAVGKKRKRTCSRHANQRRRREGSVEDLMGLDDFAFTRMMRMPKSVFTQLAALVTPHLRSHWTPHSRRMAKVGSGSVVETEAILAATIRWLAGGSVWDVSFMFKLNAHATFHDYKWRVIDALNVVLKDNIVFPLGATNVMFFHVYISHITRHTLHANRTMCR